MTTTIRVVPLAVTPNQRTTPLARQCRQKSARSLPRGIECSLRVNVQRKGKQRMVSCSASKLSRDEEGRVVDADGWVVGYDEGDIGEVDEETAEKVMGESKANTRDNFRYADEGTAAILENIKGSHYEFMGITPSSDSIAVRTRYRELSKKFHPDTTKLAEVEAGQNFMRLQEAYDILGVSEKRQYYDWRLSLEASRTQNEGGLDYTVSGTGRRTPEFVSAMDKLQPGENLALSDQAQFSLAFDMLALAFCAFVVVLAFILPESDISGIEAPYIVKMKP